MLRHVTRFIACLFAFHGAPAIAEPMPKGQIAIARAMITAGIAGRTCERYRLNSVQLEMFGAEQKLDPNELFGRYREFSEAYAKTIFDQEAADHAHFCEVAWDVFGDHGPLAHLLEAK